MQEVYDDRTHRKQESARQKTENKKVRDRKPKTRECETENKRVRDRKQESAGQKTKECETENKRGRDRKPKNKYKRKLQECKICTEKERYIVKRDCERLEIECVSSNSLPYNQNLRADNLYPKKKTIHLNTKRGNALALCQKSFRRFRNSGRVFNGHKKANVIFLDKKKT
ncbi:hypothetical protein AVEN_93923-1 [Araneus ventricosus]|uniref:Uncharacterized protein n=1 Tax=Araneus ventricosus TaxID=182803 RepID=A0A4Y2QAK1_ARAVE|nr:hypothetical protein AVEN_93923-1 [Araneus ventricosus]